VFYLTQIRQITAFDGLTGAAGSAKEVGVAQVGHGANVFVAPA
jgi:hypothetical protein